MSNLVSIVEVSDGGLTFSDGTEMFSDHQQSCCEHHYLDFEPLAPIDFEGMLFDLTDENFFERVEGYGIRLKPTNNHPVGIAGYGRNNGYYSDNITLVLRSADGTQRQFDVSECQDIN